MKQFQFYLVDEEGRSYHIENGVVVTSSQPKPLKNAPANWKEIGIAWQRDLNDVGIVKNFTTPLLFSGDARKILLSNFIRENIEKKVYLLIQKLTLQSDSSTYHFIYKYLYKGAIDFSTIKDDLRFTSANILEGGIYQQYRANKTAVFDIDLTDSELIKMDGLHIESSINYIIPNEVTNITRTVPVVFTTKEGDAPYLIHASQETGIASGEYFIKNHKGPVPINVKLKGEIKFTPSASAQKVILHLYKFKESNYTPLQVDTFDPVLSSIQYTTSYDLAANLSVDEALMFSITVVGVNQAHVKFAETSLNITFVSRYHTTYVKAITPSTLFKKLTEKITGNSVNCDTTYLDQHPNLMITSGDAIRGVQEDLVRGIKAPVIKTSLDSFFGWCKSFFGAGIGIENGKIVIAEYSHFFPYDNPIDLGEVTDFSWSYANDLIGNSVKIGYPDQNIEGVNGKFEFNNTHQYSLPITRVVREVNLVSPYLAQPYLIETRRANLKGTTSVDNQQDNEVFVISCNGPIPAIQYSGVIIDEINGKRFLSFPSVAGQENFITGSKFSISGSASNNHTFIVQSVELIPNGMNVYVVEPVAPETSDITIEFRIVSLKRVAYTAITGIPIVAQSSIFNIEELTPKRLLKKQLPWLNSLCWGRDGKFIKYESTERNDLYTEINNTYFDEDGNSAITTDLLFIPIYFNFDAVGPSTIADLLESNPNKTFRFIYRDNHYKGFLIKAAFMPATQQQQTFKLLCTPDTNTMNLK